MGYDDLGHVAAVLTAQERPEYLVQDEGSSWAVVVVQVCKKSGLKFALPAVISSQRVELTE